MIRKTMICTAVAVATLTGWAVAGELTLPNSQLTLATDVTLAAPVAGLISEVNLLEGEKVSKNQLVVRMDDRSAVAELEAAQADLTIAQVQADNDVDRRYAEKTLEVGVAELERMLEANRLFPNSVSTTEIDRIRLTTEQSRLGIEQAERDHSIAEATRNAKRTAVEAARVAVELHRAISPVAGRVVQISVEPGEWVVAGAPLARIIRLDKLRVETFVDGMKYGDEILGSEVRFQLKGRSEASAYSGRIIFVSPEVQPVTNQVRVWAEVENTEGKLRPGMSGTMTVQVPDESR